MSPVVRIFTIDPANATSSGRNPRGIVLNADGTHGYVVCPTTRDVVVADLVGNTVLQRVRSSELPTDPLEQSDPARQDRLLHLASVLVRPRLGRLLVVPSGRPHRQRDVVVRGRPAPDDLARRHLQQHRGPGRSARCSTGRRCATRTRTSSSTRAASSAAAASSSPHTDVNVDGITPDSDPNVRNYGPASSDRSPQQDDITNWIALRGPQPDRAAEHERQSDARPRHLRRRRPPAGANCVACHSGAQVDDEPRHLRPGRREPGARAPTRASSTRRTSGLGVPERLQLGGRRRPRLRGAAAARRDASACASCARSARSRPPTRSRCATAALSPINTVAPALTVLAAFGGDGFNTPTLLGVFDSAPYFRARRGRARSRRCSASAPIRTSCRRRRRTGAPARAAPPNILDSDPSAVTDLIAFLRTIDDTHAAVPRRRSGAGRSDLRRRRRALRLPEGPAARHAGARLRAVTHRSG